MIVHVKIYLMAFKNALASRMAYRSDLFISAFIMLVFELIIPFVTLLIYNSGAGFPGWKFYEVFLIQAVFLLSKGITFPFFAGIINWFVFSLLFICSIIMFMSFAFIMAASGFKWVGNFRVYEVFDALTSFAMYPTSIFSKGIQILITACIPLALMGFFPASILLHKSING